MSIVIFILILIVLIFVHELGHFLVAKWSGIRVDEFGFGYPPRIFGWRPKGSETMYSINLLPFGGFVKIFGEDPTEEGVASDARSFTQKPKRFQIATLAAGVFFNFLFAWILISLTFTLGVPTAVSSDKVVEDGQILVTSVLDESPAEVAGIEPGFAIEKILRGGEEIVPKTVDELIETIKGSEGEIVLVGTYNEEVREVAVAPEEGIVPGARAIGISMAHVITEKMNIVSAVGNGFMRSIELVKDIAVGFVNLIGRIITGTADFSQVAGPVGIVSLVGDASALGAVYLLTFTAFISLNLAVLNLIPFPALDGGRILFVVIEKIKGSAISPRIAQTTNVVGFLLLIALMVVVTYNDILRLI